MSETLDSPEKIQKSSLIVSLLGPTASGKSALAEGLSGRLEASGHSVVIIKKDDVMRKLSSDIHGVGNESKAYSINSGFSQEDVNREINKRILDAEGNCDVIILEGGTRTRKSALVTLEGVQSGHVIIKMDISPKTVAARLMERRATEERDDDRLIIALGKLAGQYMRPLFGQEISEMDDDVATLDANQSREVMLQDAHGIITSYLEYSE